MFNRITTASIYRLVFRFGLSCTSQFITKLYESKVHKICGVQNWIHFKYLGLILSLTHDDYGDKMVQNKIHSTPASLEFQIQFLNFLLTSRDQSWDAFEPMNGKITA